MSILLRNIHHCCAVVAVDRSPGSGWVTSRPVRSGHTSSIRWHSFNIATRWYSALNWGQATAAWHDFNIVRVWLARAETNKPNSDEKSLHLVLVEPCWPLPC